ncbi:MAG: GNAT family N-acetyltransferase [Pseudanabaenaceae cyanobacterium bins.39]|nr:GNAT family N-acetyltransferase [Pseudanabaenaceae cyanobacterium bins.39]
MKIRKISQSERLQILQGDLYAYSRWTNQDLPRSHLTAINPEEVLAVELDGKIVAALQCFRFQQSVRGVLKTMGGIGGVWTYPEYRNRGLVKALMKSAFLEMRMQGMGLSMLMPFKESFYSGLGYAIANGLQEMQIPIASFSNYLHHLPPSDDHHWQCDRLPATEVKDLLTNFLEDALRSPTLFPHHHGMVITNFNYDQWWHLHRQKLCVVIKRDRQPVALAIYAIDSSGNLPISDRQIEISSIFWQDLTARDRLFQFFASHRDQVHHLKLPMPPHTNLHSWFKDAGKIQTWLSDPWMVRAIDIVSALHNLPITCPTLNIAITDPHCHWNEGLFSVNGDRGQLTVKRHTNEELKDLAIDFSATIAGISALIYGTQPPSELIHQQQITNIRQEIRDRLEQSFVPCPIYNPFKF